MMDKISDLRPGDIGFGPIKGGAGLLVGLGQLMLREGFHVGGLSIRHVFVVTEARPADEIGPFFPRLVEAMPSGAREIDLTIRERWTPEYAYVRLPEDYAGQAADAAAIARAMIGTPYSFASYAALAAWRFGLSTPRLEEWIDRRREPVPILDGGGFHHLARGVALPREAICSVLADQAWSLTGKKIMEGVPHQCVTPGALATRLLWYPGATWLLPGR